jgi:P4 family phage/plasmid primase-like protien
MLNIGETVFYEKINIAKLNYIINNPTKYEDLIKEQEKDMRRADKNYNAYAVFQKIRNAVTIPEELKGTEYGLIKIEYSKGRNSNGIGRWYCKNGVGIQPLCACVRHTICQDIWLDIDQVNSHPTIFKHLIDKYNFRSPLLDECLTNREEFLKKVMKDEKCSRDTAKTLVIAIINGAKYSSTTLKGLANELKPAIEYINNLPAYAAIAEFVNQTYKDDKNIDGKIISRILQVIENNLLEFYVDFFNSKGLIENNQVALIFDGFQLLKNDIINQDILNECRKVAFDKTGYDIELKIKPFENALSLPDNYADCIDDLPSLINKYNTNLNEFINQNNKLIDNAIMEQGSHITISIVAKSLLKDTIVFDESSDLWFYCNTKNIWKKSKTSFILKGLLSSVVSDIFKIYSNVLKKQLREDTEDNKPFNENIKKKVSDCLNISLKLHNNTFINAITETSKIALNKDRFYESKIDMNGNLFAFSNKVLDCKTNKFRSIESDDYIMTNTGYEYPEYIDDESHYILNEYFNTIYPDEDMRNYMIDSFANMINGNRTEQSFNIHTGSGSNSKSTLFTMINNIFGDYYLNINAETLTKPKKEANSTGELYKAKGKRCLCSNEPENDRDNKLQVGLLKKIAGGYKENLKERGLYQEPIEFPIQFQLNILCNSKPTLSSVDGGISRRIRVCKYNVKFVEEPDENNKLQAKLNPDMMDILTSDKMRNVFIKMLTDRWINSTSKFKTIPIPKQIQENSLEYVEDCNEVLGFIMEGYIITNNEKDKVQSSILFNDFKIKTNSKMLSSKFKDDVLGISGITNKRLKSGIFFMGLKEKTTEDIDE